MTFIGVAQSSHLTLYSIWLEKHQRTYLRRFISGDEIDPYLVSEIIHSLSSSSFGSAIWRLLPSSLSSKIKRDTLIFHTLAGKFDGIQMITALPILSFH